MMRFHRQALIPGWSQKRLIHARILVAGAGALGNEVLKSLALLGIGHLSVVDLDDIEESNLSRCVLFRDKDIGLSKAYVATERIRELNPTGTATAIRANLLYDIGAGFLEEFDLVLGCVDSIGARWKLNRLARRAKRTWIDAGIDAFCGQIALYSPVEGSCYECGMTDSMWQRATAGNSCLLPQSLHEDRPLVPTTIILTSITAALQVQEACAFLMNGSKAETQASLAAGGRLAIRVAPYELSTLRTRIRATCLAHGEPDGTALPVHLDNTVTVGALLSATHATSLSLDWDIAQSLRCETCDKNESIHSPVWRLPSSTLHCPDCSHLRLLTQIHSIERGGPIASVPLVELGVAPKSHLLLHRSNGQEFWCKID
jgi:molybdopterin/thiamine biosynthesis adenylyltransferase